MAELNTGLLSWRQSEEMNILINNYYLSRVGIKPTIVALQSHPCASAPFIEITYFVMKSNHIVLLTRKKYNIGLEFTNTKPSQRNLCMLIHVKNNERFTKFINIITIYVS